MPLVGMCLLQGYFIFFWVLSMEHKTFHMKLPLNKTLVSVRFCLRQGLIVVVTGLKFTLLDQSIELTDHLCLVLNFGIKGVNCHAQLQCVFKPLFVVTGRCLLFDIKYFQSQC